MKLTHISTMENKVLLEPGHTVLSRVCLCSGWDGGEAGAQAIPGCKAHTNAKLGFYKKAL